MLIKYKNLREGDLVVYSHGWLNKEDIGILIKPYGSKLFYVMTCLNNDDISFKPLTKLKILQIVRMAAMYIEENDRIKLRRRLIKLHDEFSLKERISLNIFGYIKEQFCFDRPIMSIRDIIFYPWIVKVDWTN